VRGSLFAISSAFFWAAAVILYKKSGDLFSPLSLNIYKSIVALVLVPLTMLISGIPFVPDVPLNDWLLLALSGILGITLADLFFFTALNQLGAGLVAIVECLYLPSVLLFSYLILGENLSPGSIIGSLLVLSAVLVGSVDKKEIAHQNKFSRQNLWGIVSGILSILFLAIGIVIIKGVLEQTNVFWATLVRMAAGSISLLAILICHPARRLYFRELKFSRAWFTAFPASVCGNYVALVCWVAGMKYTTASKAAILNQMSSIFIFILAAIFLQEKITVNKTIAICLAVTGACLTIFA
jgi:drug/metabolite transporter (DMT)-like permease